MLNSRILWDYMAVKTVPGRQNMDIFDECELIWLPNVLPLNKRSNQQHYGLKLYKYETM